MPRGGKEVVVTYNGVDGACGGHGVASAGGAGRQRAERVLVTAWPSGFAAKGDAAAGLAAGPCNAVHP
jgi:hypothetical protein